MWMFKPFSGKEQTGLEGRLIEIGNEKLRVQNIIAEGGFSCVYLAHDSVNASKQYALKHMICQDDDSLDLVMKEIQVMKLLKGHPNVVTLVVHSIIDMGRRKEVLLAMEFCEKSLANVLESRGTRYFEEKQVLSIFRDVCNAVFAMHSLSLPIAHRDLKAENVLLGLEGGWKLCDYGSTSTNHKCFSTPEEMGIEEDNIRKHTTPAYRAPEMWDLYRKEVISEKVDVWALGCLLYRICYFKSAFDGESKLQILNGNYRIPESPKYSASVTHLIKDMLEGSPDARPDISQVWFRVNELLPLELQKHLPDTAEAGLTHNSHLPFTDGRSEGMANRTPLKPRRSPPPPPPSFREKSSNIPPPYSHAERQTKSSHSPLVVGGSESSSGAFWSAHHAQDSQAVDNKGLLFDDIQTLENSPINHGRSIPSIQHQAWHPQAGVFKRAEDGLTEDLNASVPCLDANKQISRKNVISNNINKSRREEELEAEVEKLKEQLTQTKLAKAEITSKYEKLSAICRSQRNEIHELKLARAIPTLPSAKDSPMTSSSENSQSNNQSWTKIEVNNANSWQAFSNEPEAQIMPKTQITKSVRTTSARPNTSKQRDTGSAIDEWGFGHDNFAAFPPPGSETSIFPVSGSSSQRFAAADVNKAASSQPSGWAGF